MYGPARQKCFLTRTRMTAQCGCEALERFPRVACLLQQGLVADVQAAVCLREHAELVQGIPGALRDDEVRGVVQQQPRPQTKRREGKHLRSPLVALQKVSHCRVQLRISPATCPASYPSLRASARARVKVLDEGLRKYGDWNAGTEIGRVGIRSVPQQILNPRTVSARVKV